ncbi:peptidylprolyl isomerase [Pseudophaeobacter arcticus]|jgi:peptidyl-prolyl cis-trans isomerase SurA|uniref:peptidylprolyl isomerase n=1 Tax=Pseudophaeobacter arcticus TaxID=385492 RepID=UPI0024914096|nr:peptidylprolyl isomerase [Pseudophaeobacter arcticus]
MQTILTQAFSASLIRSLSRATVAITLSLALSSTAAPLAAQGLFSPAVTVDSSVITHYELQQRARFMNVLRTPGNPEIMARKELIKDRLKQAELARVGISPSEEEITAGMTELAGRANLSLNEFLTVLKDNGVDPETLRDFTEVGIGWREYIGGRFLSRARPTEVEIDRAMGQAGSGGVQVLLSELIVPINEQNAQQVQNLTDQVGEITSFAAFSTAATQYSASDSRNNGGRLPWMNLTKLPPQLQPIVLALDPGEITEPLPLQGAVAMFQMRGVREVVGSNQKYSAIEYAAYYLPGGRSPETLAQGQKIADSIDSCDDLYGIAKDQDPSILDRQSLVPAEIPQDIAIELAKLDDNEISLNLTRNQGQTLMLLMLCGRTAELGEGESRETVANALTHQRLTSLAESFLEQLRADALIIEK